MTRVSKKQLDMLRVIVRGNPDSSRVDIYEICERVDHKPSRDAAHFSLRSMIKKGLIAKDSMEMRNGRSTQTYVATSLGYSTLRNRTK